EFERGGDSLAIPPKEVQPATIADIKKIYDDSVPEAERFRFAMLASNKNVPVPVKDGVQNSFRRTESSKRSGCVTDDAKPDANGTLRAAWRGRFPPARGGVPSCAGLTHQSSAHHP
ncbi:hypothetical protein, partial [Ralstonia pseudosolanacearum]